MGTTSFPDSYRIQAQAERLYMGRRHQEWVEYLRDQALIHPEDRSLVYAYAHAVIITAQRTPMDHDATIARQLIAAHPAGPAGTTPDDLFRAHLLSVSGLVDLAVDHLLALPDRPSLLLAPIGYATLAAWLACRHGRPELAPTLPHGDIAGHIVQLWLAALNQDPVAGRHHTRQVLDHALDLDLGEPITPGSAPCPALTVTLGEWLDDALDSWGARVQWLGAPDRRAALDSILLRLSRRPLIDGPADDEVQLMACLSEGRIDDAAHAYVRMCQAARARRCPIPTHWQSTPAAPPRDLEAAVQASEAMLIGTHDARIILPWYTHVLAPLIDQLEPSRRAGYHMAVYVMTRTPQALELAARGHAAAGQYALAVRAIWPLRSHADRGTTATQLARRWDRALRRSQLRLLADS